MFIIIVIIDNRRRFVKGQFEKNVGLVGKKMGAETIRPLPFGGQVAEQQ